MNRIVIVALSLACVFALGCGDAKPKDALAAAKDMSKSAGGALGDLMAKGKDAVVKAAQDHGVDMDKVIAEFKGKLGSLTGDAKTKVEQGVKSLEGDNGMLKEKISALTSAGGDGWKSVVKEIETIVARMKTTIADVKAKLG